MAKRPRCDRRRQGIGSQGGQQGWYRMDWWYVELGLRFVIFSDDRCSKIKRRQMPSSTSNGGCGIFVNLGFLMRSYIYRIRTLMFFRLWHGPLFLCKDRTVVYWMLLPVYACLSMDTPYRLQSKRRRIWCERRRCWNQLGSFFSGTLVQQESGKTPSHSIHPSIFGVFVDAAGFQWPFNSLICSFWSDLDFESYFCVWSLAWSEQLVVTADE